MKQAEVGDDRIEARIGKRKLFGISFLEVDLRVDLPSPIEHLRRSIHPKHPSADAQGYVTYSNVNPVEEMVNMISASRSYQNNVEVMNTAKQLLLKTLQLGQS